MSWKSDFADGFRENLPDWREAGTYAYAACCVSLILASFILASASILASLYWLAEKFK